MFLKHILSLAPVFFALQAQISYGAPLPQDPDTAEPGYDASNAPGPVNNPNVATNAGQLSHAVYLKLSVQATGKGYDGKYLTTMDSDIIGDGKGRTVYIDLGNPIPPDQGWVQYGLKLDYLPPDVAHSNIDTRDQNMELGFLDVGGGSKLYTPVVQWNNKMTNDTIRSQMHDISVGNTIFSLDDQNLDLKVQGLPENDTSNRGWVACECDGKPWGTTEDGGKKLLPVYWGLPGDWDRGNGDCDKKPQCTQFTVKAHLAPDGVQQH